MTELERYYHEKAQALGVIPSPRPPAEIIRLALRPAPARKPSKPKASVTAAAKHLVEIIRANAETAGNKDALLLAVVFDALRAFAKPDAVVTLDGGVGRGATFKIESSAGSTALRFSDSYWGDLAAAELRPRYARASKANS